MRLQMVQRERRVLLLIGAALQIGARAALAGVGVAGAVSIATWLGARFRRRRPFDAESLRWALEASAARTGGTCLTQALAARVLWGWSGGAARLVIGARRGPAIPEFHAWVEIDQVSVPKTPEATAFVPLAVWS